MKFKYDEDDMQDAKKKYFGTGALAGAAGIFILLLIIAKNATPEPPDNRWKDSYHKLVCKNRGLELNLRNVDRWCMDPKTKAIHEIEE